MFLNMHRMKLSDASAFMMLLGEQPERRFEVISARREASATAAKAGFLRRSRRTRRAAGAYAMLSKVPCVQAADFAGASKTCR